MVFLRRVPLLAMLAMLVWAWAGLVATAADYAFVFHAGVTASVFDAASLDLIATPNVGANARQAIGVPDPADPTSFVKIYIINDNAVRVLDAAPPFATIANTPSQSAWFAACRNAIPARREMPSEATTPQ